MATEHVAGDTLTDRVAATGPLPATSVLEIGAGIAEALEAIHAAGLVHRDLKPANVILGQDGPRVIDLGIARGLESTRLTGAGGTVGTLAYMSPEQVRGQGVGAASDVFSFGGLVCFAATGHPPFRSDDPAGMVYAVLTKDPDLSGIGDPDLAEVVVSCLAKAPGLRPDTDPIRRTCLALLPGQTRPASPAPPPTPADYSPDLGFPTTVEDPPGIPALQTASGRSMATLPVTQVVPPPATSAAPGSARHPSRRTLIVLAAAAVGVPAVLIPHWIGPGRSTTTDPGGIPTGSPTAGTSDPVVFGPSVTGSGFTRPSARPKAGILKGHLAGITSVAWSPDGLAVATGNQDYRAEIWEAATGRNLRVLTGHTNFVNSVAWSPDGTSLATFGDKTVRVWDAATGRALRELTGHSGGTVSVAWSPDSRSLATACADAHVRVWDAATGRILRVLTGHTDAVYAVAWSPDGKALVTGAAGSTVRIWAL
jgi:hypothetical protein